MTDDARIRSFLRYVGEVTSGRGHDDPPDYRMADRLMAEFRRDCVNIAPKDETEVVTKIRRGTGT
jgi:hypothetical protein